MIDFLKTRCSCSLDHDFDDYLQNSSNARSSDLWFRSYEYCDNHVGWNRGCAANFYMDQRRQMLLVPSYPIEGLVTYGGRELYFYGSRMKSLVLLLILLRNERVSRLVLRGWSFLPETFQLVVACYGVDS